MSIEDGKLFCKMIIIDTNKFAGNFERELCAYVTGQYGDCRVGADWEENAEEEIKHLSWWQENISQQEYQDGSEFYRPVTIWKSPEIDNDEKLKNNSQQIRHTYSSVAIFVNDLPPQEVLDEMIERVKIFCNNPLELYRRSGLSDPSCFENLEDLEVIGYRLLNPVIKKVSVKQDKVVSVKTKTFKF